MLTISKFRFLNFPTHFAKVQNILCVKPAFDSFTPPPNASPTDQSTPCELQRASAALLHSLQYTLPQSSDFSISPTHLANVQKILCGKIAFPSFTPPPNASPTDELTPRELQRASVYLLHSLLCSP